MGLVSNIIKRCLILKAKVYDKIRVLVESKLNTITDHISKAPTSRDIFDEEFSLIMCEKEKFHEMKADIRTKSAKLMHVDNILEEETKKALIKKAGTRPGSV